MAAKTRNNTLPIKALDDLLGTSPASSDEITEVSLSYLHPFKNHPFKVIDDDGMEELKNSISESGVMVPGIVRTRKEGGYELVAGHRRKRACELAGKDTMPVIIRELSDEEAVIMMVNSNIQREQLLFSEKAFAYKMRMDAMRSQGKRNDLTSTQVGRKLEQETSTQVGWRLETAGHVGQESGDSRNQVRRYIRLTELLPALLEMVDEKRIPFNTAVEISYLSSEEQTILLEYMRQHNKIPSMAQAQEMKQKSKADGLTYDDIDQICTEKKNPGVKVQLSSKTIKKYFPPEYTKDQIEGIILELLEQWSGSTETE
jgi:ParB family chromosome partitioning protein